MRETQVRFLGLEDPLEKEMAAYSRTLVWKIPWTEEHGRLQSMGLQRVRHNWVTSLSLWLIYRIVPVSVVHHSTWLYTYRCSFPLWFITGFWIRFPALYSRTLLFIHPVYNSLHLLIPDSQYFPLLHSPPLWQPQVSSLCLWFCFSFVDRFIWALF